MSAEHIHHLLYHLNAISRRRAFFVTAVMARQEAPLDGSSWPEPSPNVLGESVPCVERAMDAFMGRHRESWWMWNIAQVEVGGPPNLRMLEVRPEFENSPPWEEALNLVEWGVGDPRFDALAEAKCTNALATAVLELLTPAEMGRLGLLPAPPADWVEAVLRLGYHFPTSGVGVVRSRILRGASNLGPGFVPEAQLRDRSAASASEPFPGVVFSRLESGRGLLEASARACRLLVDATIGLTDPVPLPGFQPLRTVCAASGHRSGPRVRWYQLTNPLGLPTIGVRASPIQESRRFTLARRDAVVVECEVFGEGLDAFLDLAQQAGRLLPPWPVRPYPAVLARPNDLRHCLGHAGDTSFPRILEQLFLAGNEGFVTDGRGEVERWLGWILEMAVRHRPQVLHMPPAGTPEGDVVELVGLDALAASHMAIELGGLIPETSDDRVCRPGTRTQNYRTCDDDSALIAAAPHAKGVGNKTSSDAALDELALSNSQMKVLKEIRAQTTKVTSQSVLQKSTGLSKVTVRSAIKELMKLKLVHQPENVKRGVAITKKGALVCDQSPNDPLVRTD